MKNDKIRQMILDDKQIVKDLLISDSMIRLLIFISSRHSISASKLSKIRKISVQNASVKLKNLYNKGYLERIEKDSLTGGIEYIYKARF